MSTSARMGYSMRACDPRVRSCQMLMGKMDVVSADTCSEFALRSAAGRKMWCVRRRTVAESMTE
ncbi:hypothetical protein CMK11_05880 [Candidatus Poribacteria bacterium]|nr:hypothetical protein [Candidatus Poribacteria bacterium]